MEPFVQDPELGIFWLQSWMKRYEGIAGGVTARSLGPEGSYGNLAFHVEHDPEQVLRNRQFLAEAVRVPLQAMTCAQQTHGNQVVLVSDELAGSGALRHEEAIPDTDGLITHLDRVMLTLFFADCVPVFFHDPVSRVIGLAHAGWRGTVQNIAGKMVQKFQEHYRSKTENIRVVIGPSIGPCCYQVDENVVERVKEVLPEGWQQTVTADGPGFYRLDLRKTNRLLLEKEGILSDHIEVTQYCTSCHCQSFFSYRKEQGKTGRFAAFLVLKGEAK